MAKKTEKAEARKTKARKATVCVLDDPNWRSLPKTYKLLLKQLETSPDFELLAKLRSGKLDCVRRSTTNPSQYDPVQASFWQDRQFDADYLHHFGELDIYATDVVTGRRDPGTRIDGREFYVYRPEEVWRALPQATKQNEPKPVGDKTGPKPK